MRLALVLALFAIGCGATEAPKSFQGRGTSVGAPTTDDDELDNDSDGTKRDPPAPGSVEPTDTSGVTPTVPGGGAKGITTWHGHIATTPTVDFGGGTWCDYHTILSNIDLEVTLDPDGHIVSTNLANTMTETATACQAQPLGVQQNRYSFRSTADANAGLTVLQLPDPKNLPQANVTLAIQPGDAQRMKAHLIFQRTGAVEDVLNWRLTSDLDLTLVTPKATPGGVGESAGTGVR